MVTVSELTADEQSAGRRTLFLTNIEYVEDGDVPVIHLFGRDSDGELHHDEIVGHRPNLHVSSSVDKGQLEKHYGVVDVSAGRQSLRGENLYRVETKLPKNVKDVKEMFGETFEADVFYTTRFLVDTGVWTGYSLPSDGNRFNVSDLQACDPPDVSPKVVTVDIEVASEDGFPDTDEADWPVSTIVATDSYSDTYVGWLLAHERHGSEIPDQSTAFQHRQNSSDSPLCDSTGLDDVRVFHDEQSLLTDFNGYIQTQQPDILTGWFSNDFDYPYLINRCRKVNAWSYSNWSPLGDVWVSSGRGEPRVKGVTMLDMLDAYQKTQVHKLQSKTLDAVANRELGESKIEVEESHTEMWKNDPVTFLEYNKRDVSLVARIEQSGDIIETFDHLRDVTGAQYKNCLTNIDLLDTLVLREAKDGGYALPTATKPDRDWYYGAEVIDPKAGLHEHGLYPDYSCFTPDAEVLTPDGLKNITDFEVGDTVYTLDQQTHEIVEDTVVDVHNYQHDGDIHTIESSQVDISVTPDHNVYTAPQSRGPSSELEPSDFSLSQISDTSSSYRYLPKHDGITTDEIDVIDIRSETPDSYACVYVNDGRTDLYLLPENVREEATWCEGNETVDGVTKKWSKYLVPMETFLEHEDEVSSVATSVSYKKGKQCKQSTVTFDADSLIQLVGWYVSEGDVRNNTVKIANEDESHLDSIEQLCRKMGLSASRTDSCVRFTDGVVAEWLTSQFGAGSYNKKLSDTFLSLNDRQSKLLLDTLVRGDGTKKSDTNSTYYTGSETLAEDVLHLAARCGVRGRVYERDRSEHEYDVHLNIGSSSIHRENHETVSPYNGTVHCITAAENHVVYAGRNGTYNWIGQCLYPNMMYQCNISPETLIGTEAELADSEYTEDDCVWSYIDTRTDNIKKDSEPNYEKCYFLKPNVKEGFVRKVIEKVMKFTEGEMSKTRYAAMKRPRNSIYGVLGDSNSYGTGFRLYDWRMAEATTLGGRKVLLDGADEYVNYINDTHDVGAYIFGGDSVPADEPIVTNNGVTKAKNVAVGDEVWTEDGWTTVKDCIEKPLRKQLYTVRTKSGVTHVTEDHSLLDEDGNEKRPGEIQVGDTLLHNTVDVPTSETCVTQTEAWLIGVFVAEGSCGTYESELYSDKSSWAINNQDKNLLRCCQSVLKQSFGLETVIDNTFESSNSYKLRLVSPNDSRRVRDVVSEWRQMCYDGSDKVVPSSIYTGTDAVKEAFIRGYHVGDGHTRSGSVTKIDEMWTKSKLLASQVDAMLNHLGYQTTLDYRRNHGNEYYRIRTVSFHSGEPETVMSIEPYEWGGDTVYDFETDNHHFHAGIGSMIVHNTDSFMTSIANASDRQHALDVGLEATDHINSWLDDYCRDTFGVEQHAMELELESYSPKCFYPARNPKTAPNGEGVKKRYVTHITWDEGEEVSELNIKGFEAVRSDVAQVTVELQTALFEAIMHNELGDAMEQFGKQLRETVTAIENEEYPIAKLGRPFGIGQAVSKYGTPDRRPQPSYRGAKYANQFIYETDAIGEGDKPLLFYIDRVGGTLRKTYSSETAEDGDYVDAISVLEADDLPVEMVQIDTDKMIEKTLKDKLNPILQTLGYDFDDMVSGVDQTDITNFW